MSKDQDGKFDLHAIRNDLFTDTNFLKIMGKRSDRCASLTCERDFLTLEDKSCKVSRGSHRCISLSGNTN